MSLPNAFALAGLIGLLFGSFLNVCISRLPRRESVVRPGSRCPRCHHRIRWHDNIPLVSFALLGARCRRCQTRIPWRYPLVELAGGLWFAGCVAHSYRASLAGLSAQLPPGDVSQLILNVLSCATLGFLSIGLLVMDWKTQRLPDAFTLTGVGLGFLFACMKAIFLTPGQDQVLLPPEHIRLRAPGAGAVEGNLLFTGPESLVLGRLAAIVAATLLLLLVRWLYRRLRGREGMGLGDVKLLAMIAAFLGLGGSMLALFAGVLAAAVFGLILLGRGRARWASRIPFGSFLAAGGLFSAVFGPRILAWYSSLLR